MPNTQTVATEEVNPPVMESEDALDAELAELLNEMEGEAPVEVEAAPEAHKEEEIEDAIEALELEEVKQEIYEEQAAADDCDLEEHEATEPEKSATADDDEGEVEVKSAPKRRAGSTTGMKPSDALKVINEEGWADMLAFDINDAGLDTEALEKKNKSRLYVLDHLNKKQQERVVNMFRWISGGKLRNYTEIAMKLLAEKGEITSVELRDHYVSLHKSPKTANSQVSNYMHVLPAMEIATKVGNVLTLNSDSTIMAMFSNPPASTEE